MNKKCQVVMLPTEKASRLAIHLKDNQFAPLQDHPYPGFTSGIFQCQHLCILSDEEIKEGDWYCSPSGIVSQKYKSEKLPKDWKKIIATTNSDLGFWKEVMTESGGDKDTFFKLPQISESFIKTYIEEYNKDNIIKEILVEYEHNIENHIINKDEESGTINGYKLKINPYNTIIIHQIEEKKYSREDMWKVFLENIKSFPETDLGTKRDMFEEWLNKNY